MSSNNPIEPDSVEYVEPVNNQPQGYAKTVVYQNSGLPCCSGCGCLLLLLPVIVLLNLGSVISALLMVIAAAWASASLLRIAGVQRFSKAYAFVAVPVFLIVVSAIARLMKGYYPYSAREIIVGTIFVWLFLIVANGYANDKH
jgi:hypothetical protein